MEPSRRQDRDHRRSRNVRFGVAILLVLVAVVGIPLQPFHGAALFDLVPGYAVTLADLVSVALLLAARSVFLSRVGPRPAATSRVRPVSRPVVTRLTPATVTPSLTSTAHARPARPAPANPTPFRPVPARPAAPRTQRVSAR